MKVNKKIKGKDLMFIYFNIIKFFLNRTGFYTMVEKFYDRAAKILEDKLVDDMTKIEIN